MSYGVVVSLSFFSFEWHQKEKKLLHQDIKLVKVIYCKITNEKRAFDFSW